MNSFLVSILAGMVGGVLGSSLIAVIAYVKVKKKIQNSPLGMFSGSKDSENGGMFDF